MRGFYSSADRTLVSIDRGRVLLHEFTHALHHADCAAAGQRHPLWICEGLAALFENARIGPEGLQPLTDTRLLELQAAIGAEDLIGLDRLVRADLKLFQEKPGLCYAESRYLLLYLQDQGLLKRWYDTYKAGHARDATGRKALEGVLGHPLAEIEQAWTAWVSELRLPWGELRAGEGRLGLQVRADSRGVNVVGYAPGSAAERAGRILTGDVIQEFDGRPITNPAEYVAAVRAAGAMQTVTVKLIRDGRQLTVRQPLGSPAGP